MLAYRIQHRNREKVVPPALLVNPGAAPVELGGMIAGGDSAGAGLPREVG